jgi:SAM-dependent methyltransferase
MQITFIDEGISARKNISSCFVCSSSGALHYADISTKTHNFTLFQCTNCQSYFYDNVDCSVSYTGLGVSDALWIDYVQSGAGISSMLAPIFAANRPYTDSLLDIGCGFGFVVDFWSTMGGKSLGLEPSSYGLLGKKVLGANIKSITSNSYQRSKSSQKFDIVYSSEVIEHTNDPKRFIKSLADAVDDNGIIIITTPSCSVMSEKRSLPDIIAALSPGFHYGILSTQAIRGMFEDLSLKATIKTVGNQTIVWASRNAEPIVNLANFSWKDYLSYLDKLTYNSEYHLATGATARLFKDALNTNHNDIASAAYEKLKYKAKKVYNLDIENPEINGLMSMTKMLSGLDKYPSWLGPILLFGAIHVGHNKNDRKAKVRMIDQALKVLARRMSVDQQFGQEAAHLLPYAERQYDIALSEALNVDLMHRGRIIEHDLITSLANVRDTIGKILDH